ncbi:kinase-like domain-containing protein [Sporodiniella umbellata]|nr:kinase-like domain-containing protein [Sporodiniella umbellata]
MRWVKGEGDRRYMAPELLREDYNKSADIYSMGMLLLELATGLHLPGKGEGWEMIRFGDLSNQEEALSKLSPELSQLIKRLLTPDPLSRPTIEDILNSSEFLNMHEIQQNETEKSSLFDYVREREKAAFEAAKAREHNDKYSTPQSRVSGYAYPSPSL